MDENKHYIRVNERGLVTKAFSNAFEQPLDTDICVNENGGRHYNLSLLREDGLPKYKYDNGLVLTTDRDLANELSLLSKENRKSEIVNRLKEIDIKRFKFIDGHITEEVYEPYKLEANALRDEYNVL